MNLEESASFMKAEEAKNKKKRAVIVGIILCSLLIAVLFCCILVIQYQDAQTLKMFINGTQVNISPTIYKQFDNKTYVNVKEIGEILGYNYTKGEYNKFNEDETSCYLTNKFETVTFTTGEKTFKKYSIFFENNRDEVLIAQIPITIKSEDGESQKYTLSGEIKFENGNIYAPFEDLPNMFNSQLDLSQANRIKIYTLEQIVANAKAVIEKVGYTAISGDYENLKAMIYGLAVVGDGTNFGVISLTTGQELIGLKYDDITFIPNLQNFLIKAESTVGILASNGSVVIRPTKYEEISVYDEDNQLYLVKKDDKYGILNRLGKEIVYPDYDEIGYKISKHHTEYKILFNKCIPVRDGSKYGLYNLEGEELLPCVYDEFGSALSEDSKTSSNEKYILEIPEEIGIQGIVINQNGMYGVYDANIQNLIIPCVCTRAYSVTKTAQTTYYVEYNGQQINLDEYLEQLNLKSIKTETKEETGNEGEPQEGNTETNTEEVTNNPEENPSGEAEPPVEQ